MKMAPSSRTRHGGFPNTGDVEMTKTFEISLVCHSCVGFWLVRPGDLAFEVQL